MHVAAQETYQKALKLFKTGAFLKSVEAIQAADKTASDAEEMIYLSALAYTRLEKYDRAIAAFGKLLKGTKNSFYTYQSHMLLGLIHARREKFDEAETELHRLLQKNVENPQVYAILGYLYYRRKDYAQAEYYYQKSLTLDPSNATSNNGLGYTYLEWGSKLDEAFPYLQKAMRKSPDNHAILDSLGWYYFLKKSFSQALHYLGKAFRLKADPVVKDHIDAVKKNQGANDPSDKPLAFRRAATPASQTSGYQPG